MIISPGRRYVFVHIPKTGGTALTLALEARAMRDDILIGDTPKAVARRARLKGSSALSHLTKHAPLRDLGDIVQPDWFCFTIVRNPWDRLVSYYHWLRDRRFAHPAVALAKQLDFSGFLHDPATKAAQQAWPAQAYMRNPSGVDRADAYLRLEHLQQDIAPLEQHLGFSLLPLAHHNASIRARDWRGYYSDADAALIAQLCAPDIAQFGYRFDP
jgi:hypothetical protein